jgi:hypothetical protein
MVVAFGQTNLNADRKFLKDVATMDMNTRRWSSQQPVNADQIVPRADAGSCVVGVHFERLFFFGGRTTTCTYLDEALLLQNIPGMSMADPYASGGDRPFCWKPLYQPVVPTGRSALTLTPQSSQRDRVFLFGGKRGTLPLNDLHVVRARVSAYVMIDQLFLRAIVHLCNMSGFVCA